MAHILKEKISLIINGGMSQTITFIIEYPINYSGGKSIIHISFKLGGGRSVATWQSSSQPLRIQQQFCCTREELCWEQKPPQNDFPQATWIPIHAHLMAKANSREL